MFNSTVAQIQHFKLKMQPQAVPVSEISLSKVTSHNIFVSSDLDPYLDTFQGITRVFIEPSNIDPYTSRLRNQTRFFTSLSCYLELDITKPTSRKIFSRLIWLRICQPVSILYA